MEDGGERGTNGAGFGVLEGEVWDGMWDVGWDVGCGVGWDVGLDVH